MRYRILWTSLLGLLCSAVTHGQCEIYQDSDGRVYTACTIERRELSPVKTTYLGSAFLTFPIWQPGTIRLDSLGAELTGQLAYNLVDNVLLFMAKGSTQNTPVKPYTFTINGVRFISQPSKLFGTTYRNYFLVLYSGRSQLLKKYKRRLVENKVPNKGGRDINGYFQILDSYYIKQANKEPVEIQLTRKAVVSALGDRAESLRNRMSTNKMTVEQVVDILTYYDDLPKETNGLY